ncbi:MAG: DUF4190 domain-containing protein [Isosphaeraceae bacterium]|nr:DUF4190 domain-containing protein [Isosphaeraceae bacterium]
MSLEQNVSPSPTSTPEPPVVSAIENEFPTYRAISPHAILAVIAGVLSIFSIVHPFFLLCAVLAVVLGFYAERKIQGYSDVLTGRSFAQAGIALGLIFGLGTVTIEMVQAQIRKAEARAFSRQFVDVLKKGTLDEAIWYKQPPAMRRDKSPAELKQELVKSMRDPHMFEMEFSALKLIKERAESTGEEVHFSRIEEAGTQDLDNYALTVLEFDGPGTEKFPKKEELALLFLKSSKNQKTGKNEWWIEQVKYPYVPNTFVAPSKTSGDGHGHAH